MALTKMGLGAEFTLNVNPAVSSAGKAQKAIGGLRQGLGQLSMAALPVAAGFALAAKEALAYEQQLSAVQAVSGATAQEMSHISKEARMLALDTKFSHFEAAEGMEVLTRAGFDQTEMLEALRPVMDAAAADGIALSSSADIVASAIRGMGLEATDAARVADVLSKASASSNTNVTFMGESMRYAQSQAKLMGIDLETTIAAIGALGDAGLKGSIAGTSFANMLKKMAVPSGKGQKLMKKYSVGIVNFKDGSVDVIKTLTQLQPAFKKMHDAQDKAAFVSELFGIRGQKAVSAIVTSIEKGRFELLHEKLMKAKGAAQQMADVRLDNVLGQWTKLRKAFGVASTQLFQKLFKPLKNVFKVMHKGISQVLKASVELEQSAGKFDDKEVVRKYGVYGRIALGIRDAAEGIRDAFITLRDIAKDVGKTFGAVFGKDGVRALTKNIILFNALLAIIVPLGLAVQGLSFAFGGLGKMLASLGIGDAIRKLKALVVQMHATRLASFNMRGGPMHGPQLFNPVPGGPIPGGRGAKVKGALTRPLTPKGARVGAIGRAGMGAGRGIAKAGKGVGAALMFLPSLLTKAGRAAAASGLIAFFAKIKGFALAGGVAIKGALVAGLAALGPILVVILGVVSAIMIAIALLGKEGESIGTTLTRVWQGVLRPFKLIWKGIQLGLIPAINMLKETWTTAMTEVREAFIPLKLAWAEFTAQFKQSGVDWQTVGTVIVGVITAIITAVITVAGKIASFIGNAISGFILIGKVIAAIIEGIKAKDFAGLKGRVGGVIDKHEADKRLAIDIQKRNQRWEKQKQKNSQADWEAFQSEQREPLQSIDQSLKDIKMNTGKDKKTEICMDGNKVGKSTDKHRQIDHERGGGDNESWQRIRTVRR